MPRRLLDLFPHIIVAVEIENVRYQIEGILVVLHFGVQAGKVEAVGKILFVNLAKIFVSPGRYELLNVSNRLAPAHRLTWVEGLAKSNTYPVAPVACVVAICLAVEVVHTAPAPGGAARGVRSVRGSCRR